MRPECKLRGLAALQIAYMGKRLLSDISINDGNNEGRESNKRITENEAPGPDEGIIKNKIDQEFGFLLEGQMNRGLFAPDKEKIISELHLEFPNLDTLRSTSPQRSEEEIELIRKSSPDPDQRASAFIEYVSHHGNTFTSRNHFELLEENSDSSLSVQFARHWWKFKYFLNHKEQFSPQENLLTHLPLLDFAILKEFKNEAPYAIIDHLNGFDNYVEWEDPILDLVAYFPDNYPEQIGELKSILLGYIEKAYSDLNYIDGNLEYAFIRTLAYIANESELNIVLRAINVIFQDDNTNNIDKTFEPLVNRRIWGIVPKLVNLYKGSLSDHYDYNVAIEHLLNMGVYQCHNLLPKKRQVENFSTDFISSKELGAEIHRLRMEIELNNYHPSPPDNQLAHTFFPKDADYSYIYSNLLCEIDTPNPPIDWVEMQAHSLCNGYGDPDCLGRGLRKWGAKALKAVFERRAELPNHSLPDICKSLIKTEASINWNSSILRPMERDAIIQVSEGCSENEIGEWLDSNNFGVRLLATCLLIQRKSAFSSSAIEKIINDPHGQVLLTMIELAQEGFFPEFWEIMRKKEEKVKPYYQQVLDAIRKHLHSSNSEEVIVWVNTIGSYGFSDLIDELVGLSDNKSSGIAFSAIKAIRELGDEKRIPKEIILRMLVTKNSFELVTILESILAFGFEIDEDLLFGWLSHPDLNLVRIAALLCGIQELVSAIPVVENLIEEYLKEAKELQRREYETWNQTIPTNGGIL